MKSLIITNAMVSTVKPNSSIKVFIMYTKRKYCEVLKGVLCPHYGLCSYVLSKVIKVWCSPVKLAPRCCIYVSFTKEEKCRFLPALQAILMRIRAKTTQRRRTLVSLPAAPHKERCNQQPLSLPPPESELS